MSDVKITFQRGQNRGHRYGFTVIGVKGVIHDSGLIYNDEHHANIGVAKFMDYKTKDGQPICGSNVSANKHGVLGRKALAFAGVSHEIGTRT